MTNLLNYKSIGSGPPIIIVHGLFGSLDNWQSFAKSLATKNTVYTLDLRNHGKSFHSDEFNYPVLASDLFNFWNEFVKIPCVWIGHSLGGKAVLQVSESYKEVIHKLVVIDIGIKEFKRSHDIYFKAMLELDVTALRSRKDADIALENSVKNWPIRQFLLKNLTRNGSDGYRWKFNLPVLFNNYSAILEGLSVQVNETSTLFVRGEKSNYITDTDISELLIYFKNATFETIRNAGHWVHADNPEDLLSTIQNFLA